MMSLSHRSPKTEVRESKIHGRGLFAIADIAKDEIVAVKGGHIISREKLREKVTPRLGPVEIQIDDDLFIAPVTEVEREGSMLCCNHSCDANLGIRGEITFVAMRDIRAGQELTHDWATTDDDNYSVECQCGAPNCRKISYWQRLAAPGFAEAIRGIFFNLSGAKNPRCCLARRTIMNSTLFTAITTPNKLRVAIVTAGLP
jgi:hypothetical protein